MKVQYGLKDEIKKVLCYKEGTVFTPQQEDSAILVFISLLVCSLIFTVFVYFKSTGNL